MQIVIEIPDEMYNNVKNGELYGCVLVNGCKVADLSDGTPLPKGHGRLIDADEIQFENTEFDTYSDYSRAFDAIDYAPTIIDVDAESENEE